MASGRQVIPFIRKILTISGRTLTASGMLPTLIGWRQRSYIIMFHGVGGAEMPAKAFSDLLDELGRCFRFGSLDELLSPESRRKARRGGDAPSLYLTFDDGLKNNYSIAYPMLVKRAIPATFYVCPGLIASGSWIWTHEMRERLRMLDEASIAAVCRQFGIPSVEANRFLEEMKESPTAMRQAALTVIRDATGHFRPTQQHRTAYDMMNWEELQGLDPGLITVGSHTMTHSMLRLASEEEAQYEVVHSRSILEEVLSRPVRHFCYPAGCIGPVAGALVRRTYRTAVTTEYRALSDPLDLHRLPRFRPRVDVGHMAWATLLGR